MSFSVGVQTTRVAAEGDVRDKFAEFYPEPADGVKELFDGHAKQGESDRDSLNVSISGVS